MVQLSWRERAHLILRAAVGTLNVTPGTPAGDMLSRIYPGTVGEPPKRGTTEFLAAYSDSPWLRAVEQRIASFTASVPWQLYAVKRPGGTEKARIRRDIQSAPFTVRKTLLKEREKAGDLTQITEHPWLSAMDKGVANLTGLGVRKLTQVYLDTVGDTFLMKERNALGVPVAFWPLAPTWISATPTMGHRYFTVSFRGWNGEIPDTEILWMTDPDVVNPYGRGAGIAQAVSDELDTDEYAAKHTRAFFYNRARPDLIVSPKGDDSLQPQDVARLEHDWVSKNQGFWKAFKPYFMRRAVDVKELEQNFQHLQLVELRKYERDMILQVTGGIPPEMLGIIESSNRATIEAADYIMAKYIAIPRLEVQRAYYQEKLIPEYDERLIVDYVSPIPDDKERQLEAAKVFTWAPTIDESRAMIGLPPLTDGSGDAHMVPNTMNPMKTIDEINLPANPQEVVPPAA